MRTQHEQLSSRASEIAHHKLLLDKLQRMLFGAKSEKLVRQGAQLGLQPEELETSRGEEEVSAYLPFQIILTRIADHPINRIAQLPPWNVPGTHSSEITTDT